MDWEYDRKTVLSYDSDYGAMSKRSKMRKRNLLNSRKENSMPTGLIIAELFLAVMCASYVFKLTGSAMDIASSEDLFPSVVNVFMLQMNLVFLVTTIFALLGISSRRTESWKKVVKSCFTFTFSTFLSAFLLHSDSYTHAFDFNPWATLAVLTIVVMMMLFSYDIKKFYTPPLEKVRPTSSWARYIFFGKLYDSKYEVRFEKIEKEDNVPTKSS